jgi:glycine betaine/choline ABC-type transport system substrate-binding protein
MMLTGHKTPSIFERYNIIDESDLRAAVEKISEGARREFRDAEDGENGIETPTTKSNLN